MLVRLHPKTERSFQKVDEYEFVANLDIDTDVLVRSPIWNWDCSGIKKCAIAVKASLKIQFVSRILKRSSNDNNTVFPISSITHLLLIHGPLLDRHVHISTLWLLLLLHFFPLFISYLRWNRQTERNRFLYLFSYHFYISVSEKTLLLPCFEIYDDRLNKIVLDFYSRNSEFDYNSGVWIIKTVQIDSLLT